MGLDAVPQKGTISIVDRKNLTRADVEAYRAGWQAAKELELQELRAIPLSLKLKQVNMLFRFARSIKLRRARDNREIAAVRERWQNLVMRHENARRT